MYLGRESPSVTGIMQSPLPRWGSDSSILDLAVRVTLKMGRFFQCLGDLG